MKQRREPIAVLGIGCRLPEARSAEEFWALLIEGRDAIEEVPPSRFDIDAYFDPTPGVPGKIASRWGGFIDGVELFDAPFFGLSPREAAHIDPQHRLFFETAWEALEDAGQVPEKLKGSLTGVFIGIINSDYHDMMFREVPDLDVFVAMGAGRSNASGRLSYALGLQGPSMVVDSDRSSSLVAVHLACQSLWAGDCTLALVGGANLVLSPEMSIAFSRSMMLSPRGRCRFCDAGADGFVRSDGVAAVVLKNLSQALADGDPVRAVILGTAVNNDGISSGDLMTPSQTAQEQVLHAAYADAGISPAKAQYVEAHGAGTPVGDPIEVAALGAVLGPGRSPDSPCAIGSVKTNIGHAEAAAGIVGLVKVVLALEHQMIPPSLHFQEQNPRAPLEALSLQLQTEPGPLVAGEAGAVAGVSSLGLAGTNAHVVLQQAPSGQVTQTTTTSSMRSYLLPISARDPDALDALAHSYLELLSTEGPKVAELRDLAFTASLRRSHHPLRAAFVGRSRGEVAQQIADYLEGDEGQLVSIGEVTTKAQPPVAFVFPGQGAQWVGMGRKLMAEEPVFLEILQQCDGLIKSQAGWSLLDELNDDEPHDRWKQIDRIQPIIAFMQIGLATLWRSWGVEPDVVVGASLGEVVAAYVAGALTLEDAFQVVYHRSRLMRRVSGKGSMAVVGLPAERVEALIAGKEEELSVAGHASRSETILSGDPAAVEQFGQQVGKDEVFFRQIKVDVASHSPQMEPLMAELRQSLADLAPRATKVPIFSTVTGGFIKGEHLDADHWAQNLRQPFLFAPAVEALLSQGHSIFLEISPHPVNIGSILDAMAHHGKIGLTVGSTTRDEDEHQQMLGALGRLATWGVGVQWERLFPDGGHHVPLPSYPWQRRRHWYRAGGTASNFGQPGEARSPGENRGEEEGAEETGLTARPSSSRLLRQLATAEPGTESEIIQRFLIKQVTSILGCEPSQQIDVTTPFRDLGLTSLMAVELRARTGIVLERPIPAPALFN